MMVVLMFGRHPRSAVVAFLGLPKENETVASHQLHVDKQKLRLASDHEKHRKMHRRAKKGK